MAPVPGQKKRNKAKKELLKVFFSLLLITLFSLRPCSSYPFLYFLKRAKLCITISLTRTTCTRATLLLRLSPLLNMHSHCLICKVRRKHTAPRGEGITSHDDCEPPQYGMTFLSFPSYASKKWPGVREDLPLAHLSFYNTIPPLVFRSRIYFREWDPFFSLFHVTWPRGDEGG